ncbi:uncharacterized protein KY384_008024 [Bacidia gigantensis]|uniref:uncharacterized protein n=1 Tax=Bacidia gigantensis TaxID=2732470 RepID=UPI001D0439F1|nr:uncharacterized protein KY384_008024 [Bacidia gigantensis]KAG8527280.1 hypothetical protein KY384_008024 [Bacidia gigantensis]
MLRECKDPDQLLAIALTAINARADVVGAFTSQAACDIDEIFTIVATHKKTTNYKRRIEQWEYGTNASLSSGGLASWKALKDAQQWITSYEYTIHEN